MVIVLQVKNLTKEFGNLVVLDNISFDVEKGEIFGVIGMSGSGKTTLLNHLIGFLEPSEGEVLYLSGGNAKFPPQLKNLHKNMNEVKRRFGFAPQSPSFYPKLTIKENLIHFGRLYNMKTKDILEGMQHLLDFTRLSEHKDKLAEHISGGMQRRLSIMCSMVHKPDVLILDEPTADLDPVLREETWKLIKEINGHGTTVIVASHFLHELESSCGRVAIIHNGKLLKYGTVDEIKTDFAKNSIEIRIETGKENFNKIVASVNKKNIIKVSDEGNKLLLYTTDAQETLYELAQLLRKRSVTARALEVHRPSLREVFEAIALMKHR